MIQYAPGHLFVVFGILMTLPLLQADTMSEKVGNVISTPDDASASEIDHAHMSRAYEISASAVDQGNHPFGALLVKDGVVLIEHENAVETTPDITEHAETGLVRAASRTLPPETIKGSTLYTSTEPCIMCCGAIYWVGIERIVYGVSAEHLVEVIGGEFKGFTSREVFGRMAPHITITGPLDERRGLEQHAAFWPEFLKKNR